MTNHNIALPSKQKMDMNEISSVNIYRGKYHPPVVFKKKKDDLLLRIIFVLALFGLGLAAFLFSHPVARAQELTAKDCMTNECVLKIVCAGGSGYVNAKEICSN